MARAVYSYELGDPDFAWLISNFRENNPEYVCVQNGSLPMVLVRMDVPPPVLGLPGVEPPAALPPPEDLEAEEGGSSEKGAKIK